MSQNWRTEIDAQDYFGHQKKRAEIEQRRPNIRRASDLVGPGIGPSATRITDFNDLLATYNGYYSADTGADNAPNADEPFVGFVVMDDFLGGKQIFTGLDSDEEYSRVFLRSLGDPSSITWGAWRPAELTPASMVCSGVVNTTVPSGSFTILNTPSTLDVIGTPGTYSRTSTVINVLRPGVYVGSLYITAAASGSAQLVLEFPQGNSQSSFAPGLYESMTREIPLNFFTSVDTGFIRASYQPLSSGTAKLARVALTRLGDA